MIVCSLRLYFLLQLQYVIITKHDNGPPRSLHDCLAQHNSISSPEQGVWKLINHMAAPIGADTASAAKESGDGDASCMQLDLASTMRHSHTKTVGLDSGTSRAITR